MPVHSCLPVQVRYFIMHAIGGLYLDLDVECFRNAEQFLADADVVLQVSRTSWGSEKVWLRPAVGLLGSYKAADSTRSTFVDGRCAEYVDCVPPAALAHHLNTLLGQDPSASCTCQLLSS